MKPHLGCLLAGLLFGVLSAQAENYAAPILCPIKDTLVQVRNTASEPRAFWFQSLGSSPFTEIYHEAPAHGTSWWPLTQDYTDDSSAYAIKTANKDLEFKNVCKASGIFWPLQDSNSPWKSAQLPYDLTDIQLHLVNLTQSPNKVSLFVDGSTTPVSSFTLTKDFQNTPIPLSLPRASRTLQVHAEGRVSALLVKNRNVILDLQDEIKTLDPLPAKRYFLFTAPHNQEGFVAAIEKPSLIQESLDQIAHPEKARLFVARIEKSLSGENRNLLDPQKTPWSWTVVEAQNYADFAHISCDGSPAVVEERLNDWIKNTGGTICFWSYRIVREVSVAELTQSPSSSRPVPRSLPRKH